MDVNFHSSHVSGGTQEGHVCKLGFFRGEEVRGRHGINFGPFGTHGNDGWELSSSGACKGALGSAPRCFSCAFEGSVLRRGPPWPLGSQSSWRIRLRNHNVLLLSREEEGRVEMLKPDLDIVQLRAPLTLGLRFISTDYIRLCFGSFPKLCIGPTPVGAAKGAPSAGKGVEYKKPQLGMRKEQVIDIVRAARAGTSRKPGLGPLRSSINRVAKPLPSTFGSGRRVPPRGSNERRAPAATWVSRVDQLIRPDRYTPLAQVEPVVSCVWWRKDSSYQSECTDRKVRSIAMRNAVNSSCNKKRLRFGNSGQRNVYMEVYDTGRKRSLGWFTSPQKEGQECYPPAGPGMLVRQHILRRSTELVGRHSPVPGRSKISSEYASKIGKMEATKRQIKRRTGRMMIGKVRWFIEGHVASFLLVGARGKCPPENTDPDLTGVKARFICASIFQAAPENARTGCNVDTECLNKGTTFYGSGPLSILELVLKKRKAVRGLKGDATETEKARIMRPTNFCRRFYCMYLNQFSTQEREKFGAKERCGGGTTLLPHFGEGRWSSAKNGTGESGPGQKFDFFFLLY